MKSVRVICKSFGGAANDITAKLARLVAVSGAAASSNSDIVATVNSTATTNLQTITLTPAGSGHVVAVDETLNIQINGANTAGIKAVFRVEVTYDHP